MPERNESTSSTRHKPPFHPKRSTPARLILAAGGGDEPAMADQRPPYIAGREAAGRFTAMKVRDVMRRWFERVEPSTTVLEAARLMTLTGQQALPVVDDDRLVGMVAGGERGRSRPILAGKRHAGLLFSLPVLAPSFQGGPRPGDRRQRDG